MKPLSILLILIVFSACATSAGPIGSKRWWRSIKGEEAVVIQAQQRLDCSDKLAIDPVGKLEDGYGTIMVTACRDFVFFRYKPSTHNWIFIPAPKKLYRH